MTAKVKVKVETLNLNKVLNVELYLFSEVVGGIRKYEFYDLEINPQNEGKSGGRCLLSDQPQLL